MTLVFAFYIYVISKALVGITKVYIEIYKELALDMENKEKRLCRGKPKKPIVPKIINDCRSMESFI